MPDLTLVLVPLLVLPMALLFRFIGCAKIAGLGEGQGPREPFSTAPPNYRDYIMSDPNATAPGLVTAHPEVHPNVNDVIGYWRLVDPEKIGNPASPDRLMDSPAIDEKGCQNGDYIKGTCAREEPSPTQPGAEESPSSPADDFSFGHPSLIVSDPVQSCRGFDGGYVVVPSTKGLYAQEFTIEAWVWPKWGENRDSEWEHTLFFGHFEPPSDPGATPFNGFAVVADKTGHWQVRLNAVGDLFESPPVAWTVTNGGEKTHVKTHLAVIFAAAERGKTSVQLFVNGQGPTSHPVDYLAPKSGSLFIGVAVKPSPSLPIVLHRPLIGLIQEVVLHRKALSAEEIANHVDINRLD
jgi:Concanavalin A-like lectin/glucanases superfamily